MAAHKQSAHFKGPPANTTDEDPSPKPIASQGSSSDDNLAGPATLKSVLPAADARPPSPSVAESIGPIEDVEEKVVLVIATGGTIASVKGPDGSLGPAPPGWLQARVTDMPEMKGDNMPTVKVLDWEEPLDSSDVGPEEWKKLAKQVGENYFTYDGFVIVHGTDTMAYTASALSFLLENLAKPVVLTGAMMSWAEVQNDARRNLLMSILFAAHSMIPEVCVCFNSKLLRGCRTKKIDSVSFDAFDSPNCSPLAIVGASIQVNRSVLLPAPVRRLVVRTKMHTHVLAVTMTPGFDDGFFDLLCSSDKTTGLVVALYGSGNAPIKKKTFVQALKRTINHGNEVVITSQCIKGIVDLHSYATGKQILGVGAINGQDMTLEAAVTKLAYLMGRGLRREALKKAMEANLRGELYHHVHTANAFDVFSQ